MSDRKGDGVFAWRLLRDIREYRDAWDEHAAAGPANALEPGPFRVRVRSEADRDAARFGLLAWEDPRAEDGPASPFWRQDGMLEGVIDPDAEPLAEVVADGGSVEGLRLLGGDLVLKIECRGTALQVRLRDVARFPDGGGISVVHAFGLRMPQAIGRLLDFWRVAGRSGPRMGRNRREGTA